MLTKTGYSNLLLKKEKIEELRIVNQQLIESELKFRKLFEQAGVGVNQVEASTGRFLRVNKKFADMLGYTIDEVLQLTYLDFTHPNDLEESLFYQRRLLKKQIGEFSLEKRYIRKDGTIIWVLVTVSLMDEITGGNEYHMAVVQDITDRKKAEKELIESELRFRKLFELAGVGVAQVDATTGRLIKINKKFAEMLGYSIEEMLRLTFRDITYPDDIIESANNYSRLRKKQIGEFVIEKRYIRKDGTIFWGVLTVSPMGEIAGGENTQIAIVQDITEHKKAEKTLIEDNARFHAAMDAIDSVVYVADMENHDILFVNKYVKDVF